MIFSQPQEDGNEMEFDDAFKLINTAISAQAGQHLHAPEVNPFEGTWQGMTYEQMADNSQSSLNHDNEDCRQKKGGKS